MRAAHPLAAVLSAASLAVALSPATAQAGPGLAHTGDQLAPPQMLAQSGKSSQKLTPTPQIKHPPPPARPAAPPPPTPVPQRRHVPTQVTRLPYTGVDARLIALAGALLLLSGIGLRLRTADGRC